MSTSVIVLQGLTQVCNDVMKLLHLTTSSNPDFFTAIKDLPAPAKEVFWDASATARAALMELRDSLKILTLHMSTMEARSLSATEQATPLTKLCTSQEKGVEETPCDKSTL